MRLFPWIPRYDEISTGGKDFWKWSNDNDVYTEIAHGGIIATPKTADVDKGQ